jgi:four helix bundle protein
MFRFEQLQLWQEGLNFADLVYASTARFPGEERFGLTSQMRRAAVSITSNIAEGSSRSSRSDFARFVEIGYGSLMEVVSESHSAKRQRMVAEEQFALMYAKAEEIARMLSGLRGSLVGDQDS